MRLIFVLICALIVYGSLFPFEFNGTAFTTVALKAFLDTWGQTTSRGDLLGNIVLFIPFGFVGMLVFTQNGTKGRALLPALVMLSVVGIVLAVGSQIGQIAVPARVASLTDVVWNVLGTMIGVTLVMPRRVRTFFVAHDAAALNSIPLLLIGLWISSRLIPFVPTIDLQAYKDALKPLLHAPEIRWSGVWFQFGAWLACAHFGAEVMGRRWRGAYMPVGIILVLALQIVMIGHGVSMTNIVAAAAAVLAWGLVLRYVKARRRASLLALIMLTAFLINGVAPYQFERATGAFLWIPFQGFLTGSMILNAMVLCEKLFVFGAILRLFRDAGARPILATLGVTMLALGLEVSQIWLVSRTPEITDPLLVLAMGIAWIITARGAAVTNPYAGVDAPDTDSDTVSLAQQPDDDVASVSDAALIEPEPERTEAFLVRFDLEQFEFIHGLASAVKASPDVTIGSIIDEVRDRFGHGAGLQEALKERLQGGPSPGRMGKAMVGHKLRLTVVHKNFVDGLADETRASPSRVVRLLVDIFTEECQDED